MSQHANWITGPDADDYPMPGDLTYTVTLHECKSCGRRAANPPAGGWGCVCDEPDVITQDYTPTQYSELRTYGEVRTDA